jgi:hypothetical protein
VPLIVVSGAPGTGKSTIAAALGVALRFPVLSLDPIKEALADVLGLGGEDWSNQVGDAAAEVVFRLAGGGRRDDWFHRRRGRAGGRIPARHASRGRGRRGTRGPGRAGRSIGPPRSWG